MTENEAINEIIKEVCSGCYGSDEEPHICSTCGFKMAKDALEEIQQYRAIGTIDEFKALKEKSVAKKPYLNRKGLLDVKMWHCPVCKKEVASDWNRDLANDYCHNCGQKLDWQ